MPEEFYRIKRLPPYVFSEVNALKVDVTAAGDIVFTDSAGITDGDGPGGACPSGACPSDVCCEPTRGKLPRPKYRRWLHAVH